MNIPRSVSPFTASLALAATFTLAAPVAAGDHARGGPRAEMRERARERVGAKMATYLAQELATRAGLDANKREQLGKVVQTQIERRQAQRQELKQETRKLKQLLEDKASDAVVKAQLDKVMALTDRDERMRGFVDDTAAFLTPREQAQVAVAFPRVMREARRMMHEARGGKGHRAEPGLHGETDDDGGDGED